MFDLQRPPWQSVVTAWRFEEFLQQTLVVKHGASVEFKPVTYERDKLPSEGSWSLHVAQYVQEVDIDRDLVVSA